MVSILIPVWNTPQMFLRQCLDSCLFQTMNDSELIIVDNGSDNHRTLSTLEQYEKKDRVKVLRCPRQENKKNLSIALNFGLKHCSYDLVARMDSDDIMCQDRIQKQRDYLVNNPDVDILGGQINIFPNGGVTNHPEVVTKEMAVNSFWFINHPTVMYRRDRIMSIGGYKDEPELFAEDFELWLKALRNDFKIRNLPDTVVLYRSHGNNLTRQTEKNPNYFNDMREEQRKLKETFE